MIGKVLKEYKNKKLPVALSKFNPAQLNAKLLIPIKISDPIMPYANSIRFSKNEDLFKIINNAKEESDKFAAFFEDNKNNRITNIGVECSMNYLNITPEISIVSKELDKRLILPNVAECKFDGSSYQLYEYKDTEESFKSVDYEIAKNIINDINRAIFPILEIVPSVPYDFSMAKDLNSINVYFHSMLRNNNDFVVKMFSNMFDERDNLNKFHALIFKNYQELLKVSKVLKKVYNFDEVEGFLESQDPLQRCKLLIDYVYDIGDYIVKEINMYQEHKKDYMQRNEKMYYRFVKKRLDKILSKDNCDAYKKKLDELYEQKEINESAKRAIELEINQAFPPITLESDLFETLDEKKKSSIVEDIFNYPWDKRDQVEFDIKHARDIFEKNLYGMKSVKERIYEYIAKLKRISTNKKGFVILVTGPPGTGKTTIATLIGQALKRKVGIINLSGNSDSMILKGCKRTYVDAQPSIFYKEMAKLGVKNPVLVLDEIDKLSVESHKGNPADSLLEILNPEENNNFVDQYLNVPLDFSETIFICTANYKLNILEPLLDRIEVIEIDPYTLIEKKKIVEDFVIPTTMKDYGFEEGSKNNQTVEITDEVVENIIKHYSYFMGGIRGIKINIDKIIRKANLYLLQHPEIAHLTIDSNKLDMFLTNSKVEDDNKIHLIKNKTEPGYVNTGFRDEIVKLIISPKHAEKPTKFTYEDLTTKHILKQLNLIAKTEKHVEESLKLAVYCVQDKIHDLITAGVLTDQNIFENFLKSYNVYMTRPYSNKQGNTYGLAFYVGLLSATLNLKLAFPKMLIIGELTPQGYILKIHYLNNLLNQCEFLEIEDVMIPEGNRDEYLQYVKKSDRKFNVFFVKHVEDVTNILFPSLNKTKEVLTSVPEEIITNNLI
jgi:ATP-dependent Lon protease